MAYWIFFAGIGFFLVFTFYQVSRAIFGPKDRDPAPPRGPLLPATVYSFTTAMSPLKKETAHLHIPTYVSGILFHLGSFWGFFWLFLYLIEAHVPAWFTLLSGIMFALSALCGLFILVKRIANPKLRSFSQPDDYVSNLLVTGFQVLAGLSLHFASLRPPLFVWSGLLFFYVPLGKLRHMVFFFLARIELANYYGSRGVWPPRRAKTKKLSGEEKK